MFTDAALYCCVVRYDFEHTQDEQVHLDCFCVIAQGIEKNANGRKLKDLIAEHDVVKNTLDYIQTHAPSTKYDFFTH